MTKGRLVISIGRRNLDELKSLNDPFWAETRCHVYFIGIEACSCGRSWLELSRPPLSDSTPRALDLVHGWKHQSHSYLREPVSGQVFS